MTTAPRSFADIAVPACLLVPHKKLSPKERAEARRYVRQAYDAGASLRAITGQTRRSFTWIHRIAHEAGVTMRRRGGWRPGGRSSTAPCTAGTS